MAKFVLTSGLKKDFRQQAAEPGKIFKDKSLYLLYLKKIAVMMGHYIGADDKKEQVLRLFLTRENANTRDFLQAGINGTFPPVSRIPLPHLTLCFIGEKQVTKSIPDEYARKVQDSIISHIEMARMLYRSACYNLEPEIILIE